MRRALVIAIGVVGFLGGAAQAAHAAPRVLSVEDVRVAENVRSGKAVVTLRLDRAAARRATVGWRTAQGSATSADFVGGSGSVTFRAGDRVRTIAIPIRNDSLDEGTERFFVSFTSGSVRIPDAKDAVDILDDDPLPSLSVSSKTVTEGARGTTAPASVTLRLSRASGRRVSVNWAVVSGSATAGVDVVGRNTASIRAGRTSVVLPARVIGDDVAEGVESAPVKLTAPVNARVARNGVITVTDDDDPATSTDLQVQLATSRAASTTFTAATDDELTLQGGVVSATGADGTIYRLTIPDGALSEPTTIKVTPWVDVEGVSASGGRYAGVDLRPNGLELLEPATLEIIPPAGGSVDAISFAYVGGGQQAHRYPLSLDPAKLEMTVSHFSGYGTYIGEGISIPIEPAPPSDPAQALAAEIERITAEERRRVLDGETPNDDVMLQVIELMRSYYTHVISPLLPNIRENCEFAKANNSTVLGWAHQAAVLAESSFATELSTIIGAVGDGAENCLEEAMEPCVDPDDAAQRKEIYRFWRMVALLGGTEPDPRPDDPIRHCKEVLLGSVVVQYDRVWQAGTASEFHHEEHYTTTFNPRLVAPSPGYWIDDGRGGWSLTGNYNFDDTRENNCLDYVDTYSGSGVFRTTMFDNETQLNPDQHHGLANFKIEGFFSDGQTYGMTPTLRAEYVGDAHRDGFLSNNGTCEETTSDRRLWKSVLPCPGSGGGVLGAVAMQDDKRGVGFNCTKTINTENETLTMTVTGTLWLTKA